MAEETSGCESQMEIGTAIEEDSHEVDNQTPSICIICKSGGSNLRGFDDERWEAVKKAAENRLQLSTDKYKDVTREIYSYVDGNKLHYHPRPCYKNFTATKKRPASQSTDEPPSKKPQTRERSSLPSSDPKGLLKGSCIFCPVARKTVKGKVEKLSDCLTKDGCEKIISAAPFTTNERIKALVSGGIDLIAKEAQYHKSCRRDFFKEMESQGNSESSSDTSTRKLHSETFSTIAELIQNEIISSGNAMFVSSLYDLYKVEFLGNGGTEDDIGSYTTQALTRKIKDKFGDQVSIKLFNKHKGNFLYSSSLSEDEGKARLHSERERWQTHVRSAAMYLRNVILEMPKYKTPTPTSADTLKTCSPELPDDLMLFFRTLLSGLSKSTSDANKSNVDRKVMAMSSDAVFNVSRGLIRPWKQTALGLGISTLTGSALILRILNRLGYSLSYDEVKSLETEFAFSAHENDCESADGIKFQPDLATGLAWDNYDVNMETLDGRDTLHATVGICYQSMTEEANETVQVATRSGKSRRKFDDSKEREIPPMHQQLSQAKFDMSTSDNQQEVATTDFQHMVDFYWLMLFQVMPQPLFAGFFSQFVHDDLPKHKICYMDPIPSPPTRNDVVRETMKRSMQVAIETKQNYAVVTYDLAVALKAYSIQSLEAPMFDRLLIMLGNFHTELAFYGAIGTYINESGAEYILTENGILAEGSLNGFIRGKYYNRCSRVHEVLAAAMERKLYESFISSLPGEKRDAMSRWLEESTKDHSEMEHYLESDQMFKDHMHDYEKFFSDVMKGEMGPTAQFWCIYIYLINRVHRDLMRAVRMNDIQAYIAILPTVIDVFFGLNRPNYARWGVLYLEKLRSADPQVLSILEKGAFSIRRTSKDFSRTAVDMTLEQTVNRDAASPMRGIVGFHNNFNAIQRWCVTSTQRGMMVTELRRLTGLQPEEQARSQLHSSRIEKDNHQIQVILDALSESCDPFSEPATSSQTLLNIATGKVASAATQKYLNESIAAGHERHKQFKEECAEDSSRLLKPIKRRKVENFASGNVKPKKSSAAAKYTSVVSQRDSFIRMIVVISEKTPNFNLPNVLSYPITEVPLSISQPDGSRVKTAKSALLQKLEAMQDGVPSLPHIDVTAIDGGLLLHSFLSAIGTISTYGNLARRLLGNVCSFPGREVHVLFDKYLPSSLKESERKLRGADDQPFIITGSEQSPKQSCKRLLQNGLFKDELGRFLLTEWQKEQYGAIMGSKTLVVSYGGECVRINYSQTDTTMSVEHPPELQGNHEEADTLLAFHTAQVEGSVLVRVSDTDVFVILIGMLGRYLLEGKPLKLVVVDCGLKNNRRYIDITRIVNTLETKQAGLAAALPGVHAFTGCDFTAAFYKRGKSKPLDVLEKDNDGKFIKFFQDLTSREEPNQELAEEYVCSMYAVRDARDVNEARHIKLVQMTGKINKENPMENIKKVDCALLPPCKKTLINKLARAHFVSIFWGNADSPEPDHDLDPVQYGWKLEDGHYKFDWFSGSSVPEELFVEPSNDRIDEQPEEDIDEESDDDDEFVEDNIDIGDVSGPEWTDDSDSENDL